jgi:hypothetical protein
MATGLHLDDLTFLECLEANVSVVARAGRRRVTEGESVMLSRIAPMVGTVLLVVTVSAWAQAEIRGVVSYVDPVSRTVYFTDGRAVRITPGSTLTINGQPAVLESVRPGAALVLLPPGSSVTTVTTITQQPAAVAPAPPPAVVLNPPPPSPVDVTGTIARTDPLNQTVTFQDGRIVRIAPHTMVWQQAPAISTLLPGARVFVRDATPVGYLPSGAALPAPAGHYVMGTVSRVDPATQDIVLSSGTVVHVPPRAMLRSGNDRVVITQLRPGDEILVQVVPTTVASAAAPPAAVSVTTSPVPVAADRYAGSALPYQSYAVTRIEAADVQVMWSPQAR